MYTVPSNIHSGSKPQETCSNKALSHRVRNTAMWKWLCLFRVDCCAVCISMYSIQACQLILFNNGPQQLDFYFWAGIHEPVITYDGHISRPGITVLELGPSENSYSRARKRSVIVVLEVGGFHTGCLVTKRCTVHGRRVICPARQSSGE